MLHHQPDWYWDLFHDVFADRINIVLELSRDGNHRCSFCNGALNEGCDSLMLVGCYALADQVNLVLQDDDVLQLHDFHSC